ncbi:MAG: VF530 family protein [Saprospiraceae bacterium]
MSKQQTNNPLHGIKLATIVEDLVDFYGWDSLADKININCFKSNQTVKSSLKFLRKTPWARDKVEDLYLQFQKKHKR